MAVKINRTVGRPSNIALDLEAWAVDVANWVIQWQFDNDRIASGRSVESHEITMNTQTLITYEFIGYLQYALYGRKPGKHPPPDKIKQWIIDKPINYESSEISLNSLAYLIGKKIAEQGTNPPHLTEQNLTMVINMIGIKYVERISLDVAELFAVEMVHAFTKDSKVFTEKK